MRLAKLAQLILVLFLLSACASNVKRGTSVDFPASQVSTTSQEYVIQSGDLLDIKFFYNPELNEAVTVRPDGRISLQLAKELKASGTTPAQLTELLTNHYASMIKNPEVTVIVRSFSSQKVYVDGEVNRAGMIPLTEPMTVMQAIAQAGGFKDTAEPTQVLVVRRGGVDNKFVTTSINLQDAINRTGYDPPLMPYDIVLVPRSAIANVDLWVDQYIRKVMPFPIGLGLNVFN